MESTVTGLKTGCVKTALGSDGTPDRSASGGLCDIDTDASFKEWYADTHSAALTKSISIALDNTITGDPNVYTFTDSSFFPIDGELGLNEGNSHNYHLLLKSTQISPIRAARRSPLQVMMTFGSSLMEASLWT